MTSNGTTQASWWSRNSWPLVAGTVALVALLGWTLVAIDQFSDDEDGATEQVTERRDDNGFGNRDGFRFDRVFESHGVLLGVGFDAFDELVVSAVMPGTAADEAGLRAGDEIHEVGGERVRTVDELRAAIEEVDPGDEYELTITRDGDELVLDVTRLESFVLDGSMLQELVPRLLERFGEGRRPEGQPATPDQFESQRLRPTLGVSVVQTGEGLQVMAVLPGSAAAEAGFREGDVITKVGRDRIATIDELRAELPVFHLSGGEPPDEIGDAVEFTVLRDGRELELTVVFSIRPGELVPGGPAGTGLAPGVLQPEISQEVLDEVVEQLLTRLFADLEGEALSGLGDRVVDQVLTRLFADLEGGAVSGLGDRVVDEVLMRLFADLDGVDAGGQLADATVYSGSVSELGDASIVLTGVRGPVRLTITNATVFVGGSPRVGGVASVVVDANLNAVLVVVAS